MEENKNIFSTGEKEYPFYHEGMTRGEWLEERSYLAEHIPEWHQGKYVPLWKQREQAATNQ